MMTYKQICMEYMRKEKIRYEDVRDFVIKISYKGEHLHSIPILIYFDEENDPTITVKCWNIANFGNQKALAETLCNELNEKYRWVKFYVDSDADVVAELDAYVTEQNCGELCTQLVQKTVSIVDDAYPILMRALWGE